jgi:hypothetical protein
MFCKIDGVDIPLVMVGSSPFSGSPQFRENSPIYRKKFLQHADAMVEILKASYEAGARGFHTFSYGKMCDAAKIMQETYDDYVITGGTLPSFAGPDPLIEDLIDAGAKLIFIHASVSDKKESELFKLIDDVTSRGVIPGIAVHNPVPTLEFALENANNIKCFLVPFAVNGFMMGDQKRLEELVDNNKDKSFFGMKTLAAGSVDAQEAFNYISKHNICSVIIGQVDVEEAKLSTKIALESLHN